MEEIRETIAGDVLRKPLREHYDNDQDFAEAEALWNAAEVMEAATGEN